MKSAGEAKQSSKNNRGAATPTDELVPDDCTAARQSDDTDNDDDQTTTVPSSNDLQLQSNTSASCTTSVAVSRDRKETVSSPDGGAADASFTCATIPGAVAVTPLHHHNENNDSRADGGPSTAANSSAPTSEVSCTRTATDAAAENETDTPRITTTEEDAAADHSLGFATTPSQQHSMEQEELVVPSSPHLVQAELVVPSLVVQPLFVAIDEEVEGTQERRGNGIQVAGYHYEDNIDDSVLKWHQRKGIRPLIIACSILCCIVLVMSILIHSSISTIMDESSSSTVFPYDCYTSTLDLVRDQLDSPQPDDVYILCPGTHIRLGNFKNPQANEYLIVDGDYPLTALRPNVTIQCGLDGNVEDDCTLDGGVLQVLVQSLIPPWNEEDDRCVFQQGCLQRLVEPVDNFRVRGMTFTGIIDSGPVTANSVTISHPGENIRFENCLWRDMSATAGLISLGYNYFQEFAGLPRFDDQSTHVTFANCRFENIVYDAALFFVDTQSITLEDCAFRNVEVDVFHRPSCLVHVDESNSFLVTTDGCACLLFCGPGSRCSIDGMCLESFEAVSPAMIIGSDEAELTVSNSHWDGIVHDKWDTASCQVGVASLQGDVACQVDVFLDDEEDVVSCAVPREGR